MSPDTTNRRSSEEIRRDLEALEAQAITMQQSHEANRKSIEVLSRELGSSTAKKENATQKKEIRDKSQIEAAVEQARAAYINEYKRCREEMQKRKLIDKTRSGVLKILGGLGNKTAKENVAKEEEFYTKELNVLKKEYDEVRVALGQVMYDKQREVLEKENLSADEIKRRLAEYKANEIFAKVIIEERQKVIDGKIEGSDIKPAFWKKALAWYSKLSPAQKILLSTGAFALIATGGAALGIGTLSGVAGMTGVRLARGALSGTVGGLFTRGIDKFVKKKNDEMYYESHKDTRQELRDNFALGDITLQEYEEQDAILEKKERNYERNWALAKAGARIFVSAGLGYEASKEIHNLTSSFNPITGGPHVAEITQATLHEGATIDSLAKVDSLQHLKVADSVKMPIDTTHIATPGATHSPDVGTGHQLSAEQPQTAHPVAHHHEIKKHHHAVHHEQQPPIDQDLKAHQVAPNEDTDTQPANPTDKDLRAHQVAPDETNVDQNPSPFSQDLQQNPDTLSGGVPSDTYTSIDNTTPGVDLNTTHVLPPEDTYVPGEGTVSPTTGRFIDTGTHISPTSTTYNNGFTTEVPMTDREVSVGDYQVDQQDVLVTQPDIVHTDISNIHTAGTEDHTLVQTLHDMHDRHDVVETFGHHNVIIERPDSDTIQGIKYEDWNNATDHMFHVKHVQFGSNAEYEKEHALQQLFGHSTGKIEYDKVLDKNVYKIHTHYFRDDAPTWQSTNKIPAKYFFNFHKEMLSDPNGNLSQADVDTLVRAGVLNDHYDFVNQKELIRLSRVYAKFDPLNAKPIGNENIEHYVRRLTRDLHQAKDGTIFLVKKDADFSQGIGRSRYIASERYAPPPGNIAPLDGVYRSGYSGDTWDIIRTRGVVRRLLGNVVQASVDQIGR
jgi:hypothetical protein